MYGISLPTATTAAGGTATAASLSVNKSLFPSVTVKTKTKCSRRREIWLTKKNKFCVFASKEDEPKLDQYDQMELKFGRMIGEDPKLTLAKIMARKANPDVSYLEVEKSFYKNKGKVVEIKELPFDVSKYKRQSKPLDGLNLVRPTPKGVVFPTDEEPERPQVKKPSNPIGKDVDNSKRGFPNVILRKPSIFVEDDVEDKSSSRSRVRIQPNLRLKMRNDQGNEKFSDMTLLRKPEPVNVEEKQESLDKAKNGATGLKTERDDAKYSSFTLLKKPETAKDDVSESLETAGSSEPKVQELDGEPELGVQLLENSDMELTNEQSVERLDDSAVEFSVDASLQGKPMRLEQSAKSVLIKEDKSVLHPARYVNVDELKNLPPLSPAEDADWSRAEALYDTGNRGEVELVSASTRGFIVSFGSLVGFLPYQNLVAKWKFLAFESWLKQKGLDPSQYKQNLGIIGSYDVLDKNIDSSADQEINKRIVGDIAPDMKLEDLLRIYDQEKLKFLSSFVGQKVKVNVVVADRKLRKLTVSLRPKEKEELIQRKRSLMAKLQIGDVVKCCIKKITYFGIFVEVEGVPALIHQTEVSWDATLDPASYFKVGQIVEAKVHRLDFTLERVFLSLKEITPDPLIEALESVVGDRDLLDGRLQAAEADSEWADVESLIKELQQTEGVDSVSKGRFFLSPGLAPTFQVYMASMFKNQYKLLARSGNKVQEVVVEASLDKEEMKAAILSCTNRVE